MRGRGNRDFAVSFFAFQDIITAVTGVLVLVTLLLSLLINVAEIAPSAAMSDASLEVTHQTLDQLKQELKQAESELSRSQELSLFAATNSADDLRQRLSDRQELMRRLQEELGETTSQVNQLRAELTIEEGRLAAMARNLGVTELEKRAAELQDRIERLEASNRVIYNFRDLEGRKVWLVDLNQDRIETAEFSVRRPPDSFPGQSNRDFLAWAGSLDPSRSHLVLMVRPGTVDRYDALREVLDPLGFSIGVELLDATTQVIDPVAGASL